MAERTIEPETKASQGPSYQSYCQVLWKMLLWLGAASTGAGISLCYIIFNSFRFGQLLPYMYVERVTVVSDTYYSASDLESQQIQNILFSRFPQAGIVLQILYPWKDKTLLASGNSKALFRRARSISPHLYDCSCTATAFGL